MKKIYFYEPCFFIFFGIFHLHRICGLVDREAYAAFWVNVMESKGVFYFVLMGILAALCILGIVTFFRNLGHNYWWRWIYLCGALLESALERIYHYGWSGVCIGMLIVEKGV